MSSGLWESLSMNSITGLASCAETHLDTYTDPASGYAWWTYDRCGDPDVIEPVDVCAVALLDIHSGTPGRGRHVQRALGEAADLW